MEVECSACGHVFEKGKKTKCPNCGKKIVKIIFSPNSNNPVVIVGEEK